MNGTTHLISRLARIFGLALAIAVIAVPAAQAADRLVDDYFRDSIRSTAVANDRLVDDYFRDPVVAAAPQSRIVDDWFRDPQVATPLGAAPVANRLVDDYFRDASTVAAPQPTSTGFDWSIFLIGAGSMLGLVLLASGLALGAASLRHRSGTLSTS